MKQNSANQRLTSRLPKINCLKFKKKNFRINVFNLTVFIINHWIERFLKSFCHINDSFVSKITQVTQLFQILCKINFLIFKQSENNWNKCTGTMLK